MGLNKIDILSDSPNTKKKQIVFGSALDLAHIYNKEWAINNLLLCYNSDISFEFILNEILDKTAKRNFISKFFFLRKVKKARFNLNNYIHELRSLVSEIEALIGFNTFLREGRKSKIKHKKVFDDFVSERREIAIMMQGLLLFIETDQAKEIDFTNELSIISEIKNRKENEHGYFVATSRFLNSFEF